VIFLYSLKLMGINKQWLIFYFSGTGNAKQIALWFSEFSINKSIDCQLYDIAKTDIRSFGAIDSKALIFIVSPTHGFNYPKITLDFIRHFPKGGNQVVLMNTRGGLKLGPFVTPGLTGVAFYLSSLLLTLKGFRMRGFIPFDMPSNWISVHPALRPKTVDFILAKNKRRVGKHAERLFSGKTDCWALRDIVQDILIAPIALGYYFAGRFALAKSFYASVACDNCGLCIKQCPVKAIKSINNRPFWKFSCESCMKCMNSCPKKAIESAHGLFLATSLLSSSLTTVLLHHYLQFDFHSKSIRFILLNLVFFFLLWLMYRIQHLLLKNRFAGKLISFTSLTHYGFWGRYKLTIRKNNKISE
jgi:Pyruvate/2-oxoacid:ferredoxin oxidoreductase delta subunit